MNIERETHPKQELPLWRARSIHQEPVLGAIEAEPAGFSSTSARAKAEMVQAGEFSGYLHMQKRPMSAAGQVGATTPARTSPKRETAGAEAFGSVYETLFHKDGLFTLQSYHDDLLEFWDRGALQEFGHKRYKSSSVLTKPWLCDLTRISMPKALQSTASGALQPLPNSSLGDTVGKARRDKAAAAMELWNK